MDNRHLCRGKRSGNLKKDWVVGHYVSVPRHMIVLAETMLNGSWNCFDIDPTTIGRCTGLHAAKSYRGDSEDDRLVFEGDILKTISDEEDAEFYRVAFEDFRWKMINSNYMDQDLTDFVNDYTTIEIIGTIHDDPGLLGAVEGEAL